MFVTASAYYVGTEIISLAAGETKDPRKSIPRVSCDYLLSKAGAGLSIMHLNLSKTLKHLGQISGD